MLARLNPKRRRKSRSVQPVASERTRDEVAALGIKYPVVTNNDYSTLKAYRVEAWPTLFVLDKQGRVRWAHVGEGAYNETEEVIKRLIAENPGQKP
jgi:hypothetical protein